MSLSIRSGDPSRAKGDGADPLGASVSSWPTIEFCYPGTSWWVCYLVLVTGELLWLKLVLGIRTRLETNTMLYCKQQVANSFEKKMVSCTSPNATNTPVSNASSEPASDKLRGTGELERLTGAKRVKDVLLLVC
ncbi:hypothetical protein PVAR5_1290 [Paecilomyces variotii No. 5]|uniref:Uncharacterized protein n=1 Tax=Byssochlamys spectabilis (strain No. 5 / NBRC 109023) TaxID=1356009 RepID=V5FVR5_BYSSN|nr:hypothetical protein PVAR5_1290 [Paecilomyces variotii No. 5]